MSTLITGKRMVSPTRYKSFPLINIDLNLLDEAEPRRAVFGVNGFPVKVDQAVEDVAATASMKTAPLVNAPDA